MFSPQQRLFSRFHVDADEILQFAFEFYRAHRLMMSPMFGDQRRQPEDGSHPSPFLDRSRVVYFIIAPVRSVGIAVRRGPQLASSLIPGTHRASISPSPAMPGRAARFVRVTLSVAEVLPNAVNHGSSTVLSPDEPPAERPATLPGRRRFGGQRRNASSPSVVWGGGGSGVAQLIQHRPPHCFNSVQAARVCELAVAFDGNR